MSSKRGKLRERVQRLQEEALKRRPKRMDTVYIELETQRQGIIAMPWEVDLNECWTDEAGQIWNGVPPYLHSKTHVGKPVGKVRLSTFAEVESHYRESFKGMWLSMLQSLRKPLKRNGNNTRSNNAICR